MSPYPDDASPMDQQFGEFIKVVGTWVRKRWRIVVPVVVGALLLYWLSRGLYMVGPGEVGVVRTFGKEAARTEPGLRYRFPWPFQYVDVVNVERIGRIEVGFRTTPQGATQRVAEESLMLTGDENIVEAQVIVQYRIKDPTRYLFRLYQPESALHSSVQVALRTTVGKMPIEDVLTVGRAKAQDETRTFAQRLMDDYESGITITEIKLQVVDPPDAVKDAFHDVVRAREDKEKMINQAKGYQADLLPKARGSADQLLREAEGYREQRVLRAQGEAARFTHVLAEYEKAKLVTRERLYLETIEKILPRIDKIIVDGEVGQRLILPLGTPASNPSIPALEAPARK